MMTNSALLEQVIQSSGLLRNFIMKQIGIRSYTTLRAKIANESEFTASEIDKLCEALHLDKRQREAIFFAKNGESHSA